MDGFLNLSLEIGFICVVLSVVLAFVRMVKGPSLQDRVVALDFMTVAIVAFCGLAAVRYGTSAFLDVALVLALVGFLATVALARFAERNTFRTRKEADDE
ncbi:monovalent cation/H+ antiporter complex subunit F [Marivita sp.]|uniref:monovalent cation/H+ antiporter complex subunit F n=1 Tax=Marivita sp. TaxID=2003365 RepID=UPI0025B984A0|nr:monovalent cation/H+ antiporter complex subunit F [Marivita sp.]